MINTNNRDIILTKVVNMIENSKKETGIEVTCYVTLMTNGMLLSGNIVSFDKYMQCQVESIQREPQCKLGIAKILPDLLAKIKNEIQKESTEKNSMLEYIHLNNVFIINADGSTQKLNGIFRLKLSDVSGFHF